MFYRQSRRRFFSRCRAGSEVVLRSLNGDGWQAELSLHDAMVYDITIFPDGKRMLTASQDGSVRLWEVDSHDRSKWQRVHTYLPYQQESRPLHRAVAFDEFIVSELPGSGLALWPLSEKPVVDHYVATARLAYVFDGASPRLVSRDGQRILVPSSNRSFNMQDSSTGKVLEVFPSCDFAAMDSAGSTVLTFDVRRSDSALALRTLHFGKVVHECSIPIRKELRLAVNVDTARVAISSWASDGETAVWDITKGEKVFHVGQPAEHIEFSPDGGLLLTVHRQQWILWDWAKNKVVGKHTFPDIRVDEFMRYSQAFDQDNNIVYLASTLSSRDMERWNYKTDQSSMLPSCHSRGIVAMARTPKMAVTTGIDGYVKFWDKLGENETFQHAVRDLGCWSPDIISSSDDGRVLVLLDVQGATILNLRAAEQLFLTNRIEDQSTKFASQQPLLKPPAAKLRQLIGSTQTVLMRVANVGQSPHDNWFFLNSMKKFRDPNCFTIVIPKEHVDELASLGLSQPSVELFDLVLRVTGEVTEHEGRIQIQVDDPKRQLEILRDYDKSTR